MIFFLFHSISMSSIYHLSLKSHWGGGEVETYLVAKPNLVHNLGFTMYPVLYYIITFSEVLTHIST